MQLRAYSQAEKYFKTHFGAVEDDRLNSAELAELVSTSKERLVHIRSLRKEVTVRSNVPFAVEVFGLTRKAIAQREAEDPNEGVTFQLYPGRYRIRVVNPDYGVC